MKNIIAFWAQPHLSGCSGWIIEKGSREHIKIVSTFCVWIFPRMQGGNSARQQIKFTRLRGERESQNEKVFPHQDESRSQKVWENQNQLLAAQFRQLNIMTMISMIFQENFPLENSIWWKWEHFPTSVRAQVEAFFISNSADIAISLYNCSTVFAWLCWSIDCWGEEEWEIINIQFFITQSSAADAFDV